MCPAARRASILTPAIGSAGSAAPRTSSGSRSRSTARPTEVIGVLPPSFKFLSSRPAVLLPLPLDPSAPRCISFGFQALARLKPGVTLEQANADVARMISLLPPAFASSSCGRTWARWRTSAGNVAEVLWILLAAVGVVLLIACGNVANLFLVRAEARHQELATRAALGASRSRLARTLLAESVVLALAGGVLGVALASVAIVCCVRWAGATAAPRRHRHRSAGPVVRSGGLDPERRAVRAVRRRALWKPQRRDAEGAAAARRRRARAPSHAQRARHRPSRVGADAADRLGADDSHARRDVGRHPGFTGPEQVQTFVVAIPRSFIPDDGQAARTHQSIAERLGQVPGVASVGLSASITMDGEDNGNSLEVEGFPDGGAQVRCGASRASAPAISRRWATRLVAGRAVDWSDIFERRPVVVVSETLAREYWQDPSQALGKRVRCCGRRTGARSWASAATSATTD